MPTKKTPAKINLSEHAEQAALIKWWQAWRVHRFPEPGALLFAIPNGGARDAVTGHNLKLEGVLPGIPDLFLAWPVIDAQTRHYYAGLFIEMKRTDGGTVSIAQQDAIEMLTCAGYQCVVCHGARAAQQAIIDYVSSGSRSLEPRNQRVRKSSSVKGK